jgi:type III secretion protein R
MEVSTPLLVGYFGGFFLLAVLTLTAFVKISVVFMIVRNAIGLQQVPSNMVVMGLALFLSIFISMPVLTASLAALSEAGGAPTDISSLLVMLQEGIGPFQGFMSRNTNPEQLRFFVDITNKLWAGSGLIGTPEMFVIQVPAFLLSELTRAFEIGFLLYLPFIAIDLAVTGILMALGMQQVQPSVISVPFKLLLFVYLDGWVKLVEGLLLSYST